MSAQYLVSMEQLICEKPRRIAVTVNSPQVYNKKDVSWPFIVESFCIVFRKYILLQDFRLSLVLNLFLISHQISGLFSYEIVLMKKM